jgi:putative photosynthetic complex assembly protein
MSGATDPSHTLSPWLPGKPHPGDVPRDVLIIVGFVMLFAILLAAFGDKGRGHQFPTGTVVAQRSLVFADAPDGSVIVSDASNNKRVAVLPPKSNAFIRTTMRGIAHAGSHEFAVEKHAVLLTLWNDGRLTLDDPVSGRHLELEAFGKDNAGAYAGLLTGRGL